MKTFATALDAISNVAIVLGLVLLALQACTGCGPNDTSNAGGDNASGESGTCWPEKHARGEPATWHCEADK